MEDSKIVDLYWQRSDAAIEETAKKYGRYCHCIAYRILHSDRDAEECVNDAYMSVWNDIPPARPSRLQQFIGVITRNIALNRYDYNKAAKRSAETDAVLEEFWECVPDRREPVEDELMLKECINKFLAALDQRTRIIFMRRYWYLCSVKEIADGMNMTRSNVKVILHRTRNRLKACLEKEGILL